MDERLEAFLMKLAPRASVDVVLPKGNRTLTKPALPRIMGADEPTILDSLVSCVGLADAGGLCL